LDIGRYLRTGYANPHEGFFQIRLAQNITSQETTPALAWYHTRGMRKFGRPDLSIHNVPAKYHEAVIELCNRFIEFQAFGGIIEEGQAIRMKSLPEGMTCHHEGTLDDLDFNNFHVEIVWLHERN
jgi:hypothetical protein